MSGSIHHGRTAGVAATLAVALMLPACGACGIARTVTTAGEGFDRGACLSEQFRTGKPCDQDRFAGD